eukprot:5653842-Amphidinium_carterae.1
MESTPHSILASRSKSCGTYVRFPGVRTHFYHQSIVTVVNYRPNTKWNESSPLLGAEDDGYDIDHARANSTETAHARLLHMLL